MVTAVRSFLFMLTFYTASLIFVLWALAAAWISPGAVTEIATGWSRFHRRAARWLLGQ